MSNHDYDDSPLKNLDTRSLARNTVEALNVLSHPFAERRNDGLATEVAEELQRAMKRIRELSFDA